MSSDPRRRQGDSLSHPRATALFARTIYRELRRANYGQQDLVRFVGDLMEVVTASLRKDVPDVDRSTAGVIDPETGLPNRITFEEILDFEIRRAEEVGGASLLVVCVEVHVPSHASDAAARETHERTATALQRRLRADDVVARFPPNRYFVLLRNATSDVVLTLCSRFGAELHGGQERGESPLPAGTRFKVRWAVREPSILTAKDLITQCTSAASIPLGIVEDHHAPISVRLASVAPQSPEPEVAKRRVVLALGGGAVRAGAHVGVVEVLREAGVEIAGIAGTSAGALVGAMLLVGQSCETIIERFEAFTATDLYKELRRLYAVYMRGAKRSRHAATYFRQSGLSFTSDIDLSAVPDTLYAEFIEYFVGPDRDFSALAAPFAACATDIVAGRHALFMRGRLHHALRASCAVPGLFAPQRDADGRLLVDGSTVTEVPIAAALALRVSAPVLGVYLEEPPQKVDVFTTSAEVMTRTAALVHSELVREQLRMAPLLLSVPVKSGGWLDFKRADETRNIGAVVTRVALDGLLADLDRLQT